MVISGELLPAHAGRDFVTLGPAFSVSHFGSGLISAGSAMSPSLSLGSRRVWLGVVEDFDA